MGKKLTPYFTDLALGANAFVMRHLIVNRNRLVGINPIYAITGTATNLWACFDSKQAARTAE